MNLHEYQGKELLKNFNVEIQRGHVASTEDEAVKCAEKLTKETGTKIFVVNCLLYTSPSPRDSMTSRMPSSA